MSSDAPVQLPMGWWDADGRHRRTVALRTPTAEDQLCLAEGGELLQAEQVTLLLDRCIRGAGRDRPSSAELVLGDREALLLHLRRLTFGDRLECVITCPATGCTQVVELGLSVSALLLPPYAHAAPEFTVPCCAGAERISHSIRLPTGADQTEAARLARGGTGHAAAAQWLLERCAGSAAAGCDLEALGRAMRDLDPQADIELELECPVCGQAFIGMLDAGSIVLRELRQARATLLREIHLLASRYHWNERALLRMSPRRRSLYLGQLRAEAARA